MKSKFGSFDFGSVEVLSRADAEKVKGGAYGAGTGGGSGVYLPTNSCYTCSCNTGLGISPQWSIQVPSTGGFNMAYNQQAEATARCRSMGSNFNSICSFSAIASLGSC